MISNRLLLQLSYIGLTIIPLISSFYTPSVYVHMIITTFLTILIGSLTSLKHQDLEEKQELAKHQTEVKKDNNVEYMTTKDAWMFPVVGSCVLFSLYLVFKFLPADTVNMIIKGYFYLVGTFALTASLVSLMDAFLPRSVCHTYDVEYSKKIHIPKMIASLIMEVKTDADSSFSISVLNFACFLISIGLGYLYLLDGSWIISNIFGISFSLQGISLISIGSTINGLIMLWGLLIYDVFWVFGTDVMVTVAKKFDAPVKLLFPRGEGLRNSMLGLGDIVVPGIFIALMLRLDYSLQKDKKKPVDKYYFWSVMVGYVAGLSLTVWVMYAFEAAQPALLYLVPTCSGSVFITALVRNQLSIWFNYTESKEEEKKVDGNAVKSEELKKDN